MPRKDGGMTWVLDSNVDAASAGHTGMAGNRVAVLFVSGSPSCEKRIVALPYLPGLSTLQKPSEPRARLRRSRSPGSSGNENRCLKFLQVFSNWKCC